MRVRFAPSPTGYLHVGGLRTALFNNLFARRHGGVSVLRIEDTDRTRLVEGATDAIVSSLTWTGIEYDESPHNGGPYGPYTQSERLDIYRKYADQLLASGKAYRDFRPPVSRSDKAGSSRAAALTREAYLPPDEGEAARLIAEGKPHVIRLKVC